MAEKSIAEKTAWLTAALSHEKADIRPRYPLELDGKDISDVFNGNPTLEIEFREVEPEVIGKFENALHVERISTGGGGLQVEQTFWHALEVLLERKMIHRMVLPCKTVGGELSHFEVTSDNPKSAIDALRQRVRRTMIIRAIVETASEHYATGGAVEDDLGNLPDASEEPPPTIVEEAGT